MQTGADKHGLVKGLESKSYEDQMRERVVKHCNGLSRQVVESQSLEATGMAFSAMV